MNDKQRAAHAFAYAALASLALLASPARADDYFSPTDERFRLSLGAMHVSTSTTLRVDSSFGVQGSVIDGENQFGLNKSDIEPKFQAMVRIDTRNRLTFEYFTLDRTGNSILPATSAPIIFRDVTLLPTDPLQTQLSMRTFGITYGYSFWHSEKLEIAVNVGAHSTDVSSTVKVQTATRHVFQSDDQAGVVPTVGLDATWVASKRFYFDARAQYLQAHVDNVEGSIGFYELDALYRFRPNVSFALGYTDIKANLTSHQSTDGGEFDLSTKGPELFVRVAF